MNPNMTNRQKVLPELSQIDLFTGPFNLIFSPSAGPAQAPVLHRGVLFSPGVLPSPGEAPGDPEVTRLHHPRARGPGHHLPVPVLGL